MKTVSYTSLAVAMLWPALVHACSVAELRKVADEHLERLPGNKEQEISSWKFSAEGGSWQMFERENATPHSIVITYMGETGQAKERVSFLNRHDFAVVKTQIDYTKPIYDRSWSGDFKVEPARYFFFCEDKPVVATDLSADGRAKALAEAEKIRHHIFDELTMLRAELERVPEKGP